MFPLNSNQAYIKETGERSTLGAMIGSGGGGSSVLPEYDETDAGKVLSVDNEGDLAWELPAGTPDYNSNIFIVGVHGDYTYYVPMNKMLTGSILGYEIKYNSQTTGARGYLDVYSINYVSAELMERTLITELNTDTAKSYSDTNIAISWSSPNWSVALTGTFYKTDGTTWTSPISINYQTTTTDDILLFEDPTATT